MIDAKTEKQVRRLIADCPLGHYRGRVMMPRHMTEEDLVAWIDRLYEVKDLLREIAS
jgi:hypothetical protein